MADNVNPPTESEVIEKLQQLVSGKISREEASSWASPWVTRFDEFKFDNRELDRTLKCILENLAGADTPTTDREYLFERIDFEAWLQEISEAK